MSDLEAQKRLWGRDGHGIPGANPNYAVRVGVIGAAVVLIVLIGAFVVLTGAPTPNNQRQLEVAACKLISAPPSQSPNPSSFEAISVPNSTLLALQKTDDESLKAVVRAYDNAAIAQNTDAMIRTLANGVKVCHGLGLKTAN